VAILAVMVYHSGLVRGGFLGVDVFFALSGFLITGLLADERARTGRIAFGKFYMRRALRLLPALLLVVAVCGGALLLLGPRELRGLALAYMAAVLFYVANWAAIWGLPLGLFSHTWSLAIEEQYYLLWPLLLGLLLRAVPSRLGVLLMVLMGAGAGLVYRTVLAGRGASIEHLYYGLDTHGDALLVGCAAGLLVAWRMLPERPLGIALTRGAALVGALGLWLLLVGARYPVDYVRHGASTLAALGTGLVMVELFLPGSWLERVLRVRPLAGIGRISYGLYLWHFPVFIALGTLAVGRGAAPPGRIALAWGTTFAVALASFFLLERPALRLKERFAVK
jgi:peptidoglycan/LPS O-acetylase OafA/YrhL